MRKIYLYILLISLTVLNISNVYAQQPQVLPGCSYILIDSKTGQVIAEHNADEKHRPASTTKIMTAIIALENGQLDSRMKVSQNAVYDIGPGGMNIGIMAGEENLTLENLLNVMLIKSANETANIIAENIFSARDEFIDRMNSKAVELGALNTHFVNPCGKDDLKEEANHLSTARDMATIARYAMTLPKFREIVSKEYYNDMPATNKHDKWDILRTTNKLLWYSNKYDYVLDGQKKQYAVTGIKTGYTSVAGFNLVCSAVDENGMELIAAIMHVTEGNNKINSYAKEIFKYGFENYSNQKIVDSNRFVKSVEVQDAKDNKKLDLVTGSDLISALPLDKSTNSFESTEYINPAIKAPVKKGDVLGYVEYKRKGVLLGKVDLVASQNIEKNQKDIIKNTAKGGSNKLSVTSVVFILLAVAAAFLLLRMFLRKISKKLKERRYSRCKKY